MRTIKTEELVLYLPHDVKASCNTNKWSKAKAVTVVGITDKTEKGKGIEVEVSTHNMIHFSFKMEDVKPILRPLWKLTCEADRDSRGRYLIEELVANTKYRCDAYDEWVEHFVGSNENERVEILQQAPFELISELLRHHFDILGLINEGLAIDINSNPQQLNELNK